jgi:hypothetical protein
MEAEMKQVILTNKVSKASFQMAQDELDELKFALQCITQIHQSLACPLFTFFSSDFQTHVLGNVLEYLSRN